MTYFFKILMLEGSQSSMNHPVIEPGGWDLLFVGFFFALQLNVRRWAVAHTHQISA